MQQEVCVWTFHIAKLRFRVHDGTGGRSIMSNVSVICKLVRDNIKCNVRCNERKEITTKEEPGEM